MNLVTETHPWLASPEAYDAACKAVQIPLTVVPQLANSVSAETLESEALCILYECGAHQSDQARIPAHLGSMWEWPEVDRTRYAVRTIGYALRTWLRTRDLSAS